MILHKPGDPWSIDHAQFFALASHSERMRFLLSYAILAPSGHNTQPWLFEIVTDGVEVFADFDRRLPNIDPDDRELLMSVGAAIMNLRVAASHFGLGCEVITRSPSELDPLAATVKMREPDGTKDRIRELFPAIVMRRTNRQPFNAAPLSSESFAALLALAAIHPDAIRFLTDQDKALIAELVAEGDRVLMESVEVRGELAEWLRPLRSASGDGLYADAFGIPEIFAPAASSILRRVDLGGMQGRRDAALVSGAPLVVVLMGDDEGQSLVEAGQILETLLLTVTLSGLQYSFMNQPLQVPALRRLLNPVLQAKQAPQLILRVGYAPEVREPMPRRDLVEVLRGG